MVWTIKFAEKRIDKTDHINFASVIYLLWHHKVIEEYKFLCQVKKYGKPRDSHWPFETALLWPRSIFKMHSDPHLHSRELKRRDFDLSNKFENASHTAHAIRAHVNTLRCVTRINTRRLYIGSSLYRRTILKVYLDLYRC